MSDAKGDFSKGSILKTIIRLGLPITLAELVHVLYNIVDRRYIGNMPGNGTLALTGLGISFPLITLINAFANLFSTGGATLATIARGEGDDLKAQSITNCAFTMLLMTGAFLSAVMFLGAPLFLVWLGGDSLTLSFALDYFRVYVLGTVPVLISLGMNPFINAQGFPREGMITVILGAALNIALDPLFIYTFGMGVSGAALATVISQTASALWALIFLHGRRPSVRLTGLELDRGHILSMIRLGMTGFTFKMTNSVTQAVVNLTLRAWGGALSTLYIGAVSLINSVREIISLPSGGLTTAGQSVTSYNYGAGLRRRVSESIRVTLTESLLINTVLWAVVMFFPRLLLSVFSSDEELIDLTVHCARIYFGAFPFMALQTSGQTTFVALNRSGCALFFSLLRKIVLVAPFTLLLPALGLGADGVFWAEFLSQVIGATACFTTMYHLIWKKMKA